MFVSIIVPTYNEAENVPVLVSRIKKAMGKRKDYEILIADDDSPDRTWEIAEHLGAPVRVLRRTSGVRGLAPAVFDAFALASGDIVGVIDADLQHPPEKIPALLAALEEGADISVGSRLVAGGSVEGWPRHRKLTSRAAMLFSLPLTSVKDPMSGYFFLRKSVLSSLYTSPQGYKILLEILGRCSYGRVVEVPIQFKDRSVGGSKLTWKVQLQYLHQVFSLYLFKVASLFKRS